MAMQVFTIKNIDVTPHRKTGEATFEHMKLVVLEQESMHKLAIFAVTSDAAGESRKARKLLVLWRPSIVSVDCFSHQYNLSVGGEFTDFAFNGSVGNP